MANRGRGRPSVYTPEIADEICRRLAEGESLRAICREDGMPDERTVRDWALRNVENFSPQYTIARELQAHKMAEDILDISDTSSPDRHQVDRLRVDSRKWYLSKVLPKVYGDRIQHAGHDDGPLVIQVIEFGKNSDS